MAVPKATTTGESETTSKSGNDGELSNRYQPYDLPRLEKIEFIYYVLLTTKVFVYLKLKILAI